MYSSFATSLISFILLTLENFGDARVPQMCPQSRQRCLLLVHAGTAFHRGLRPSRQHVFRIATVMPIRQSLPFRIFGRRPAAVQ
jgi:hypothetical protein